MSEEKAIRVLEFSGKRKDYDSWKEKQLARAEVKGYRKLLLCQKNEVGYDVIPTASEIDKLEVKTEELTDKEKKIIEINRVNKKGFMDLILSMNTTTVRGQIAFRLVRNCKSATYPDGNVFTAWNRLESK